MQQKLKQQFGHSLSLPTFGGHFQYYMLLSIKQVKRHDVIQWLELNRIRPTIKMYIF